MPGSRRKPQRAWTSCFQKNQILGLQAISVTSVSPDDPVTVFSVAGASGVSWTVRCFGDHVGECLPRAPVWSRGSAVWPQWHFSPDFGHPPRPGQACRTSQRPTHHGGQVWSRQCDRGRQLAVRSPLRERDRRWGGDCLRHLRWTLAWALSQRSFFSSVVWPAALAPGAAPVVGSSWEEHRRDRQLRPWKAWGCLAMCGALFPGSSCGGCCSGGWESCVCHQCLGWPDGRPAGSILRRTASLRTVFVAVGLPSSSWWIRWSRWVAGREQGLDCPRCVH